MSNSSFSRRGFLKGLAVAGGLAAGTRLAGGSWLPEASAAPERSALLCVFLEGGYNALFCSAGSFTGSGAFGCAAGNVSNLGSGLIVDKASLGSVNAFSKAHMASIGIRHGISAHAPARLTSWTTNGSRNYAVALAAAMGGSAPIKAAMVGDGILNVPNAPAEGGVSFQKISDMESTIRALGGGAPDPRVPDRQIAAAVLERTKRMSQARLDQNKVQLASLNDGYDTAIDTLKKPVQAFDFNALAAAYGHPASSTAIDNTGGGPGVAGTNAGGNGFRSKMVAAELMINAGSNVVVVKDARWDTHSDNSGAQVRGAMNARIMPPLKVFLDRMMNRTDLNVVVALFGDFSRSLPGSDHQPNLTATVIGKYVKQGTTGKVDANVGLAAGTPSIPQFWAYLAAVTKTPGTPFGANPHALVL